MANQPISCNLTSEKKVGKEGNLYGPFVGHFMQHRAKIDARREVKQNIQLLMQQFYSTEVQSLIEESIVSHIILKQIFSFPNMFLRLNVAGHPE